MLEKRHIGQRAECPVAFGDIESLSGPADDIVGSAGNVQTLSITIYSMVKKRVSPEINALSTIMFVVVLLVLLVTNIRSIRKERAKEKKMMKL